MDGDLFQKLWDEILSQPNITGLYIVATDGDIPESGESRMMKYVDDSLDPIEQLKGTLNYLKKNPFSATLYEPKKRGRKKKV